MANKDADISRGEFLTLAGLAAAGATLAGSGCRPGAASEQLSGGDISFSKETDALVIGTGGAGLWAAYELCKAGVPTLVLEKSPSWGGDTLLACGVLPVHGTKAQKQQGIEDMSAEQAWEAAKERLSKTRVPELHHTVIRNSARAIDIWTDEFGIDWMPMDKDGYTKFFHLPKPGMHNEHKLFGPLAEFASKNGAEFMFETRALDFIIDQEGRPVGVRVRDEVSRKLMDIRFKKVLLATGDWVANQEMIATYLPKWSTVPPATYTSMGQGVQMAMNLGADLSNMDSVANLMSHSAPTVVWGFYNSLIHVYPDGRRVCNENRIFDSPGHVHKAGYTFWWSIFDNELAEGYHHTSFKSREKQPGVEKADSIEELAKKMLIPVKTLKATYDKYNRESRAGKDTEFGKRLHFNPLTPPLWGARNVVVRYKTNGGLKIDEQCRVIDRAGDPIPNLFAAGSCQGETTPNVNDVSAVGMHAGQMMAAELKA